MGVPVSCVCKGVCGGGCGGGGIILSEFFESDAYRIRKGNFVL